MSAAQRPLVIQTEHLDAAAAVWLSERCELVVCPWERGTELQSLLPGAEGLLIRTYTRVDAALLDKAPHLKLARAGVGLDNVDVEECRGRGVAVVSTPGANTRAVVELVTSYMIDSLRPRAFLQRARRRGVEHDAEEPDRRAAALGSDPGDRWAGAGGFGVARLGAALDMRALYTDLLDFTPERRSRGDASLARTPAARGGCADAASGRKAGEPRDDRNGAAGVCKPDVVLINTSRGFVLDAAAWRRSCGSIRRRRRSSTCTSRSRSGSGTRSWGWRTRTSRRTSRRRRGRPTRT